MASSLRKTGSTTRWRKIREMVFQRDGRYCSLCQAEDHLHIDHIIERQRGGTDELWNLRVLCVECHKKRTRGGFFVEPRTPPTPHVLLSPLNGGNQTSSSSTETESVAHG